MKLSDMKEEDVCILKDIHDSYFESRARAMGLVKGSILHVVRNQKKMPVLIYTRDTLIAVHREEAKKMEVEYES